jgi:hypothetical protein
MNATTTTISPSAAPTPKECREALALDALKTI